MTTRIHDISHDISTKGFIIPPGVSLHGFPPHGHGAHRGADVWKGRGTRPTDGRGASRRNPRSAYVPRSGRRSRPRSERCASRLELAHQRYPGSRPGDGRLSGPPETAQQRRTRVRYRYERTHSPGRAGVSEGTRTGTPDADGTSRPGFTGPRDTGPSKSHTRHRAVRRFWTVRN